MSHFRILPVIVLALAMALPGAGQAAITETRQAIVVMNHKGGNVLDMVKLRSRLERSGKRVEVRGYCRSACTMLITMRNACLGPHATIGFHAPRIPNTQIIPPYVDQIMGMFYRNGIRERWEREWKGSLKMHKITARDYIRLDPQSRICNN
ncbi:hypothetical protein SAMN05421538_101597 [Paracoccus isoporae]|uniref:Uncharacterized protein n=1 Tax=Paracoccus isoporae TaxID=591205 RepID=A0A1G6UP85_9RHOB|nr:hypothetical protein [Paracoccus isoporae]SDD43109.1 hypothetical protein SAMN05421538_101597 [Paracoccus isoporae]